MKKIYIIAFVFVMLVFSFDFLNRNSRASTKYFTYDVYADSQYIGSVKNKSIIEDYIAKELEVLKAEHPGEKIFEPKNFKLTTSSVNVSEADEYKTLEKFKESVDFNTNGYKVTFLLSTPQQIEAAKKGEFDTLDNFDNEDINELTDEDIKELVKSKGVREVVLYAKTKEDVNEALEKYIGLFVSEEEKSNIISGTIPDNLSFGDSVVISYNAFATVYAEEAQIPFDQILDSVEIANYLTYRTTEVEKTYKVKKGDSIESVAFDNKLEVEMLLLINPQLSENSLLAEGEIIKIQNVNPVIDVLTKEILVVEKKVDYNTITEKDSSMLTTAPKKVKQKGEEGLNQLKYEILHINGDRTEQGELISEIVITSPKEEIVVVGTKKPAVYSPPTVIDLPTDFTPGSGRWRFPTTGGYISSGYGYRNGRLHKAIDIAGQRSGSPILAADSGVVVASATSGWNTGSGKYVTINHGNGYSTRYSHLNRVDVKTGQKVSAGQVIGGMGRSGWATGIHLHFVVMYKGKAINPCKVVRC